MPETLSVQASALQQLETQVNDLIRAHQDLQQAHITLQHNLQQAHQQLATAEHDRQLSCQQLSAVLSQLTALEKTT